MSDDAVLALSAITKRFGGVLALDTVDFVLRPGTIHALIGENGAGKTTLMRVAYGLIQPDAGSITVGGHPIRLRSAADAISHGVGMVHQHYSSVPAMTVAENVALGGRGRFSAGHVSATVREYGARVGISLDPAALASTLSVAELQRLEIIKALAHDARVLILDEPTAVLAPSEARDLLQWLRQFAANGGAAVLITHKLNDAQSVADEITVLRHGRAVLHTGAAAATAEGLAAAMLGTALGAPDAAARGAADRPVRSSPDTVVVRATRIGVVDARGVHRVRDASFEIRTHEIVGVAGVDGSGHAELLQALGGRVPVTSGDLTLPDSIAFIPEDRHRDALVLDFTVTENVALRGAGARRGLMPWRALTRRARTIIDAFDVRGSTSSTRVRQLSGGNQQKLVLGRELADSPRLVVGVSPTRGLDIRATAAVHHRLQAARDGGAAVVWYSSDLDELLPIVTRLLVVHAGTVVEAPVDRSAAGVAMVGGTAR